MGAPDLEASSFSLSPPSSASFPSSAAAMAALIATDGDGLKNLVQFPAFLSRSVAGVSSSMDALPPLISKLFLLYAYAALTVTWAVLVVRRLRPGLQRFIASIPVVVRHWDSYLLKDGRRSVQIRVIPPMCEAYLRNETLKWNAGICVNNRARW